MQIIAHRGARFDAPENTISAFQKAFEQGADGIEVDARLTADEKVVLFHDDATGRMSYKNVVISRSTLETLKQLDVGTKRFKVPESIPTMDELVAFLPPGKQVFVEIKGGGVKTLELLPTIPNCALASFNLKVLKEARQLLPDKKIYWVHDVANLDAYVFNWMMNSAKESQFDGFFLSEASLREPIIAAVKEAGFGLYAWTVNNAQSARRLERWGVDGVITDKPGWLRAEMKSLL